jgi:branched-subunit amino acid transport protein AzlD
MFHLKYQEVGLSTEIGTGFSFERERPFLLATSHSFLPAFVFFYSNFLPALVMSMTQIYLSATYNL